MSATHLLGWCFADPLPISNHESCHGRWASLLSRNVSALSVDGILIIVLLLVWGIMGWFLLLVVGSIVVLVVLRSNGVLYRRRLVLGGTGVRCSMTIDNQLSIN